MYSHHLADSGIDFTQFSAAKVAYSTVDGANYGVPFDNGAVSQLLCVQTLLEQAGYTVDDFTDITWSDYMEKAKVVLEKTGLPMLTAQAGSPDVIMEMLQSCRSIPRSMRMAPANIADNDVLKKCVEIYAQMVADGTLVEVTDWDQYISSLNSSTVASTFNGCWIMASIQAAEDQSGKWAITNMPKLDDVENATNYSNNGGSSWAISSNTSHKDLAVDFPERYIRRSAQSCMMMLSPRAHLQRGHRQVMMRTTYRFISTVEIPFMQRSLILQPRPRPTPPAHSIMMHVMQ